MSSSFVASGESKLMCIELREEVSKKEKFVNILVNSESAQTPITLDCGSSEA